MALYRGMNIGTAKPTAAERAAAPHHLINIIEPSEEFSVAQYLEIAEETASQIRSRGREVLFVGGTALYLKALLRGLFSGPPADWKLRGELEEFARVEGPPALHARLRVADPAAAAKLHPNDVRRVIRALEVHQKAGSPISHLQRQFESAKPADECRVFVLDWPKEQLEERIRRRVDAMFAQGLVEEVRRLIPNKADRNTAPIVPKDPLSRTASQAVGYREVLEHLAGKRNLPETIELVKLRTRQFAKRQMTWFRSLSECRFVAVANPLDPAAIARQIAAAGKTHSTPC